jgi:hypothetical protein
LHSDATGQFDAPIIMMSACCRVPCGRLRYADACIQKGDVAALLSALRVMLCCRTYGLCQSVNYFDGVTGVTET